MGYGIHNVELTAPLPRLVVPPGDSGFAAVLRRRGRPVGYLLEARAPDTSVEPAELATLIGRESGAKLLQEALADELGLRTAPAVMPPLTVTICTKDRPALLRRLLGSLLPVVALARDERQAIEVLVVDNAPADDGTRDAVLAARGVRYEVEPRAGLDFARNRALAVATGEWIAYLDDDVVVDDGWLDGLREAWTENPDAGAFTGLVLPFELVTEAQIIFERRGGFRRGFAKIRYGADFPANPLYPCAAGMFGAGCNMAFHRDAMLRLGGFDEALDTGRPLPGGGDLDAFYRIVRSGLVLAYEPRYLVFHQHRREMDALRHPRAARRVRPLPAPRRANSSGERAMIEAPCRIHHIDLAKGTPPPLTLDPGAASLLVVFWWRGIPLGAQALRAGQLPMPESEFRQLALRAIAHAVGAVILPHGFRAPLPEGAARPQDDGPPDGAAISALEAPLAALERALAPSTTTPSASLVICTRDRPQELERCLTALRTVGTSFLEIVVVDNGPVNPATRAVVERFPGIVYVPEPRPGLSVARNTGIRASRGAIVAFTDDDVVIHPDWPARLRAAFADPSTMVVTGLVLPAELETEAQVAFEQELGGFSQGFRPLVYGQEFFARTRNRGVPVWKIGAGANMAFRREIFEAVGYFDERLGPGASGGCGDNSELWYRILAAGYCCRYEPTAVVFHRHRETWDGMLQQLHAYLHGHVIALFIQYWRHGHVGNLYRIFVVLPRFYAGLLWRACLGRLGVRRRLLRTELAGWVSGVMASLRLARVGRR